MVLVTLLHAKKVFPREFPLCFTDSGWGEKGSDNTAPLWRWFLTKPTRRLLQADQIHLFTGKAIDDRSIFLRIQSSVDDHGVLETAVGRCCCWQKHLWDDVVMVVCGGACIDPLSGRDKSGWSISLFTSRSARGTGFVFRLSTEATICILSSTYKHTNTLLPLSTKVAFFAD